MTRQRRRRATIGVSLFPFLAVLVCTMGALIVLLVMFVEQARVQATEITRRADTEQGRERREQEEQYVWQWQMMAQQRDALTSELADQRLVLAHLEDHLRRLKDRWEELRALAAESEKLRDSNGQGRANLDGELARVRGEMARASAALEAARAAAARKPRSYSIVPYEGPNGTRRRPIYVECRATGVVLQPEGIVLTPADFDGPLGPGNPLDASLRAVREYRVRAEGGRQGEPYPLLIVRPDGVEAYAYARTAMRGWDDEFGYELVESDMTLAYPPPDPALAALLKQAIHDARQRQQFLKLAMPRPYADRDEPVGFVATSRGGFAPDSPDRPEQNRGFGTGMNQTFDQGFSRNEVAPPDAGAAQSHRDRLEGRPDGQVGATSGAGVSPLARQRGRNWALPNGTSGATGITRAIRVACSADRLVILPERGQDRAPVEVLVGDDLSRAMDEFVARLWDHIDDWGLALVGGYWQPILQVEVAAGGEQRFRELAVLLEGSGIQVERK